MALTGNSTLRDLTVSLALAAVVLLLVFLSSRTAAFGDYELWGYDFLVNHATSSGGGSDLVIVDFDDATYRRINQYPIPRSSFAQVIAKVGTQSPRVIGLDVLLAEIRNPAEDAAMRSALQTAGNVIVASQARAGGIPAVRPASEFCQAETPEQDSGYCKESQPGALGYAAVNLPIDSDGFIRSFYVFAGGARNGVSFPVMISQLAKEAAIRPSGRAAVRFLNRLIPTTSGDARRVLIGTWCIDCIKHISAISLLEGSFNDRNAITGKIVLIGQSNDAARDLMLTPAFRATVTKGPRRRLSGVEVHALSIEALLTGRAVAILPAQVLWPTLFVLYAFAEWLFIRYAIRMSSLTILSLMIASYIVAQALFDWSHVWFHYTAAIFGMAVSVPVGLTYRFAQEKLLRSAAMKERAHVMELFSRYVSPEVAQQIWEHRDQVVLAGEERVATVLFSDIRGFTALTAGKDSSIVLRWLNEYLTAMDEVIRRRGGFLNKFIGDGLMVLFGVPLSEGVEADACKALHCGIDMLREVERLNVLHTGDDDFPKIKIGIGVHTGKLTCGNIGSRNRVEYSVIGETVNLASRLESVTKDFEAPIVISHATYLALGSEFPDLRELGEAPIRGFEGRSRLYGILPSSLK